MSDKKRLFGTFGVRRTANDVLTPEFASRLAACYGTQIQGTVAVGGDTRTSSPMLMEAVKAGLLSSGCDVVDLGILIWVKMKMPLELLKMVNLMEL